MSNPLIVAALKDEVRQLKAKMAMDCTIHFKPAILYRGGLFNKEVHLLITGMGVERMKKGLEQALAQKKPSTILYVGYAGGCSPIAGLGTLVLAKKIVYEKEGEFFLSDERLLDKAKKLCGEKKWSCQVGGLVTVDRVVSSPHEKADLGALHEALALDMEAAALASVATRRGIPFLVAKAVLDPMEMALPNLENCIEPTGEAKPFAIAEHLFKTPSDLMKFPQIQYHASQARETLAKFVEGWMGLR